MSADGHTYVQAGRFACDLDGSPAFIYCSLSLLYLCQQHSPHYLHAEHALPDDPPEYDPDDAEAQRIAETCADANTEYDRTEQEDRRDV